MAPVSQWRAHDSIVRANTIFAVIHAHHLRTAWADKHPAYDIINGNDPDPQTTTGPGTNVDDFFAPEINSDLSDADVEFDCRPRAPFDRPCTKNRPELPGSHVR